VFGQGINCGLSGSSMGLHISTLVMQSCGYIDDISTLLGSKSQIVNDLAHVEGALRVNFHDCLESFGSEGVKVSQEITSSTVDQNVNFFKLI
jgi:hypothetical protein